MPTTRPATQWKLSSAARSTPDLIKFWKLGAGCRCQVSRIRRQQLSDRRATVRRVSVTPKISNEQRRIRLLTRHHLATENPAGSTVQAARGVLALHATDPATICISALVRDPALSVADVTTALHDERTVLRMMAMRRTLFVVPKDIAPIVQAAASQQVAATAWKRLAAQLATAPTDPPLPAGITPHEWLRELAESVIRVVAEHGPITGTQISGHEPRLKTALLPTGNGKAWDVRQAITSQVLMAVGAEGHIIRGKTQGGWTSRRHQWESARLWWPAGMPNIDPTSARAELVKLWLERFGPATVEDIRWWTGWSMGDTKKALAALKLIEVELEQGPGVVLADDLEPDPPIEPVVNLLPALDPTPMGWKERDWYFAADRGLLFDRNGNIGPTIWSDGQIVGGWATGADGLIRTKLLIDIGAQRSTAIAQAAASLEARLGGAAVIPSFRTPLEKELAR